MPSSRIKDILKSAEQLAEPIRVQGATASSRALLVARYIQEYKQPIVILCANDDIAADFASDLESIALQVDRTAISVSHFPTWEQSPYSPIAPSIRTRLNRIATLTDLRADTPAAIVTTLAAACQCTLPLESLEKFSISIEKDKSIESREALMRRLLDAGYLRVDPVEDPGTFAVRGEIIDIFPTNRLQPIRVELFGDEVEKIREFDAATQRAKTEKLGAPGSLNSVLIPPAREVLINLETTPRVREKIKLLADDTGIPRTVRDPILASVQDGLYPDHSDAWAPFAYQTPATLWDYIPDWSVIWNDELSCQQEWDQFLDRQNELAKETTQSSLILPAVGELFRWSEPLERKVRNHSKVYLDRVAMADLSDVGAEPLPEEESQGNAEKEKISTRHQVFVRNNADLKRGTKHSLGELEPKFKLWLRQGFKILALASTQSQLERIRFLLEERNLVCQPQNKPLQASTIHLGMGSLSEGFRWPAEGLVILTESDILGSSHVRAQKKARVESGSAAKDWSGLQALADLSVGDAVVHVDHGIGRYLGIVRLDLSGAPSDFLLLEYANKDKLYLPVYRLNVIQKYSGAPDAAGLDRLGSQQFAKTKEKVRESVKKLAIDLVQLYAERKIRPGIVFSPRDAVFREFEDTFPFTETPDQLKAIDAILCDMESGRAMDRLVCGDVGYGKTEVAIRAAFRAVSDGKQVAVLVPTTILAHQHEQSFRARLKDHPFVIDSVSRFKSAKEQKAVLERTSQGQVDILIGTHRLLSRDVKFRDLGLVIVDEEHRFGVEHKEKLKTLKINTHVLTLTATPIPRTLHFALSGLRDISLINTPPVDRLPIRTYVSKYDEALIQRAIEFELNRGGQVFFLHNRVQSIYEVANTIRQLVPKALIGVAHGQMAEGELEEAMVAFYQKRTNVLVCTSIIESGLDVPSANTLLVTRADALGLAQLYQIRGRVGRGQQRAYAYLLIPAETALTEDAKRRLEVIQKFVELGSGFSIAAHDLEIRGGGDLLGAQQSGHIAAVGFDLYTELLEEAIQELRGKPLTPEESRREPEIKAPFPAYLAEEYVPDVHQRLSLYRRFSAAKEDAELNLLEEELLDRFGTLPAEAQNLLWLIRVKILLKSIGIDSLTVGPERISMTPGPQSKLDPVRAIALVSSQPKIYQLTPDSKFVAKIPTPSLRDLYFGLETLFKGML